MEPQTHPSLTQFLAEFKRVAPAIVDSYFIVDLERRIVDFNRAFYAMMPRTVARGLKGKRCFEVIELNICKNECIAKQCWTENKQVRLDEISGNIIGEAMLTYWPLKNFGGAGNRNLSIGDFALALPRTLGFGSLHLSLP